MGKAEGNGENWHGHVTAVTVGPEYRRLGLAKKLMNILEEISENVYDGYFVDLFVRMSNRVAINMYKGMGYSIYRQVIGYYSGEEDALGTTFAGFETMLTFLDMRKALPRDKEKKSIIPLPHPVYPNELD